MQNRVKNTSAEEQNVSSGPLPASTLLDGEIGTAGDSDGNPSPRTGRTTAAKISRVGTGLPTPAPTHTQGSPQFCCTQMCFRGWGQSGQRPGVTVYPSGGEAWARGSPRRSPLSRPGWRTGPPLRPEHCPPALPSCLFQLCGPQGQLNSSPSPSSAWRNGCGKKPQPPRAESSAYKHPKASTSLNWGPEASRVPHPRPALSSPGPPQGRVRRKLSTKATPQ